MSGLPTTQQVLDCPMDDPDSGATTVGGYLMLLLEKVWAESEGFSGKRPFGNSGWQVDVYAALRKAGLIDDTMLRLDADGYVDYADHRTLDKVMLVVIRDSLLVEGDA